MGNQTRLLFTVWLCTSFVLLTGCASPENDAAPPYPEGSVIRPTGGGSEKERPGLPKLDETSQLSDYLTYAALNNPGLEAAFDRWKAELERVPQMKALPDPMLTYRFYIDLETGKSPMAQGVEVEQTFPWFGKRGLRGDVATEEANAAQERYEAAKLKLFYEVKEGYYEYYYLGRSLEVVTQTRDLMKYLEEVARAKYRVGTAQQADVIRAQVELGKLEDQILSLNAMREPTVAQLNAALNRPLTAELPWPKSIAVESIVSTDDEIIALLEKRSPELKAIEHEIAQYRKAVALARKEYYPDVTISLGYQNMATDPGMDPATEDMLMAGVSINLPIWVDKYRAGEREARARQWASIKERTDRSNQLGYQVKRVMYDFRDAERKMSLYRDTLVPIARESVKVTEAGFRAGTSSFLDVVDAERVMLDFQLSYERALASHAQRLAELEMLVGEALPRAKSEPAGGEQAAPAEGGGEVKPETKPEAAPEEKPAGEKTEEAPAEKPGPAPEAVTPEK